MYHDPKAVLSPKERSRAKQSDLAEGYRRMAADKEREVEAEEWTEGLIGDAY